MEEPQRSRAGRSCGNCRGRRIRCDRRVPACANCATAKLQCQGYGLRLSWPRVGDRKRALLAPGLGSWDHCNTPQRDVSNSTFFINMQEGHVAAYYNAMSSSSVSVIKPTVSQNQMPKPIPLSLIDEKDTSLLHYYLQNAASFFLNPLGSLAQLLLQIGLADSSPSSAAVLNGLLAISALHVSGEERAIKFKTKAIAMTQASLKAEGSGSTVIAKIAASMLLYLYETLHMSSPKAWSTYLGGVKQILSLSKRCSPFSKSYQTILDWISYHETMAKFGQLYWPKDGGLTPFCHQRVSSFFRKRPEYEENIEMHATGCDLQILEVISNVFDLTNGKRGFAASQPAEFLTLEWQLRIKLAELPELGLVSETSSWMHAITMLHCLAALLWVNRSVNGYKGTEGSHQWLVTQAVNILNQLKICDLPWPLFIIAGEMQTEEQRRILPIIIVQTQERSKSKHMDMVEELVEAMWNYNDLDPSGLLHYNDKLRCVMQAYPWILPFT
uniref:Zn(2)-C6 fungal-type domain-containing protein n=1 Tax=Bionectria ochroleuca TaxID=29856 RepID=A0A8H7N8X7_BIOOC